MEIYNKNDELVREVERERERENISKRKDV